MKIEDAVSLIDGLDSQAMIKAERRFDSIAKPLKSLGLLEKAVIRIAGIQKKENIDINKKCIAVFCSDNGIVNQGVTQCGQEVTAQVCEGLSLKATSVCNIAQFVNADIIPIDVGIYRDVKGDNIIQRKVDYSTKDFTYGAAMTRTQALKAIETGIDIAFELKEKGYNLIGTGEMGIGNTTTTSAIAAVLLNMSVEDVTGKGAGLSDEGFKRKIKVIKNGIEINKPDKNDPIDVLSKLGGFDIGAMTGLYIGGAATGVGIVMDGVISAISALLAVMLCEKVRPYILPSHLSAEPLGDIILKRLEIKPLICAEMRLGEGTGSAAAFLLYDMIDNFYKKMSSFDDMDIEAYKPL